MNTHLPRTRVLVWMFAALVPAFAVTGVVTRLYEEHERTLAAEWFGRGEEARRTGDVARAVEAFQTALRFSPDNRDFIFALAQALLAAGRATEARAYLLMLWESEPGGGRVNIELGRLAARDGNTREAIRYFHNAIEGAWAESAEERRRDALIELAEYLIRRRDVRRAQAELLPLLDDLPEDPSALPRIGQLLLEARLPDRARAVFDRALRSAPANPQLIAGAGKAAFEVQDYDAASRHLARAVRAGADDGETARLLERATGVIELDPYRRGLSRQARTRRVLRAFDIATARLAACAKAAPAGTALPLAALAAQADGARSEASVAALARDLERVDVVMDVVFRIEETTAALCGEPTGDDAALLLIAQRHEGAR